jgi:hypothetical protein
MTYKKGFSLLSFLLYSTFFSFIAMLFCHLITVFIIPSFYVLRKNQSVFSLHIATDFFVRDIKSIEEKGCLKLVVSCHQCLAISNNYAIRWSFFKDHLERKEGVYKDDKWGESHSSIAAKNIKNVLFMEEKQQNSPTIVGLSLTLTPELEEKNVVECYVCLNLNKKNDEKE